MAQRCRAAQFKVLLTACCTLQIWLGVSTNYTIPYIESPSLAQQYKQMAMARGFTW
jgi:hypothetical protein